MKKYYILVSSILFSIKISWAQNLFQRIIGSFGDDSALCVNNTKDNGYLVGGYTFNLSNSSKDAIVIKLNNSGAIEWQTNFGNSLDEQIFDIHEAIDGTICASGSIASSHHFICKLNKTGSILWYKEIDEIAYWPKLTLLSDATILLCSSSGYSPDLNILINKFNPDGSLIWQKSLGGNSDDWLGKVVELPNKDLLFSGSTGSFGEGNIDIFITKTNAKGDLIWSKVYGLSDNEGNYNLDLFDNGDIFINSGSWSNPTGNMHLIMKRLSSSGDLIWAKHIGESGKNMRSFTGQVLNDGGIISEISTVNPNHSSGLGLIKLDQYGNFLWSKNYGGNKEENSFAVKETSDGGFILVGYTNSFSNEGKDIYIVKTNNLGETECNFTNYFPKIENWNPSIDEFDFSDRLNIGINSKTPMVGNKIVNAKSLISAEKNIEIFTCNESFSIQVGQEIFNNLNQNGKVILMNDFGCDSIININLNFQDAYEYFSNRKICFGDSTIFFDEWIKEPGEYSQNFIAENGCDSIYYLKLEIEPMEEHELKFMICDGETISINNETYNKEGTYTQNLVASDGCDSLLSINITQRSTDPSFEYQFDYCSKELKIIDTDNNNGKIQIKQDGVIKYESYDKVFTLSTGKFEIINIINDSTVCRMESIQTIEIGEQVQLDDISFPNIIAPDLAVNNEFCVSNSLADYFVFESLKIYDRFGNLVFRTSSVDDCWDGKFNNSNCEAGVYTYIIEVYGNECENPKYMKTGDVTVLR